MRRLQKNITIIEENIEGARKNIGVCEQNVEIIKGEFAELDKLLQESNQLAETYRRYLSDASREEQKNSAAVASLQDWRKRALASVDTNTPEGKSAIVKVEEELQNRELWKRDTAEKRARMTRLLRDLEGNAQRVQARRNALNMEIRLWQKRVADYKALIKELETNKATYEKVLARSP